jgi:hypothetical protein
MTIERNRGLESGAAVLTGWGFIVWHPFQFFGAGWPTLMSEAGAAPVSAAFVALGFFLAAALGLALLKHGWPSLDDPPMAIAHILQRGLWLMFLLSLCVLFYGVSLIPDPSRPHDIGPWVILTGCLMLTAKEVTVMVVAIRAFARTPRPPAEASGEDAADVSEMRELLAQYMRQDETQQAEIAQLKTRLGQVRDVLGITPVRRVALQHTHPDKATTPAERAQFTARFQTVQELTR